ncbi:hypothetical protein CYY_003891 [Polysphondylium violaceum]|uniref:Mitochondrial transferase n=1 Tax=Polysphondylium violaceum TaxID=133409 RepID=A0A8J4V0T1_9MYCE|nr:hypothetical protein CYY_003891 [Polysphondylium violaceum]
MINLNSISTLKKCLVPLRSRSLIKVVGVDAFKHLQGLTTNNLARLKDNQISNTSSIFNGFLQSNGRLLFDSIISLDKEHYQKNHINIGSGSEQPGTIDSYIIDIDSQVLPEALDHLKKFKLRNKIDIIDITDGYQLYSILDKTYKTVRDDSLFSHLEKESCSIIMDPRHPIMGIRVLVPNSKNDASTKLLSNYQSVDEEIYHLFRMSQGIPEGKKDFPIGATIPLEYNFELLNGVDFHKGCYLGQELTSRTHFTGLVRKRVFPLVMKVDNVESVSVMDEAITDPSKPPKETLLFPKRILNSLNQLKHPDVDSVLKVKRIHTEKEAIPLDSEDPAQPAAEKVVSRSNDKILSGNHSLALGMLKIDKVDIYQLDNTIIHDKDGRELTILPPCWLSKIFSLQPPTQQVS